MDVDIARAEPPAGNPGAGGPAHAGGEAPLGRRLVVLVPGLSGKLPRWRSLQDRLSQEPEYDPARTTWLPISHGLRPYSLGSLQERALNAAAKVNAEWLRHGGFDDVVLIGHSMGGPLVRRMWLLGLGIGKGSGVAAGEWANAVSRIVLLAAVSRGVDMRANPGRRLVAALVRLAPLPRLAMEDAMRGSHFLTNLRIDWIRHFCAPVAPATHAGERDRAPPLVVQLLGSDDSLVGHDDSCDVLAFPNGHYLTVPDANHTTLFAVDEAPRPEQRYAVLRRAFVGRFEPGGPLQAGKRNAAVEQVVFLLHGIRAAAVEDWLDDLAVRITNRGEGRAVAIRPEYGWVSAIGFALPPIRRKYVRVLQDEYTEAVARYPNARFSVIAHSNGTYILGHAMLETSGMRFRDVFLAGSVLPQDFWGRFRDLPSQVDRIRNVCANRDWPVALLCSALRGLRMRDVGIGGFAGFLGSSTQEVAYLAGGHGEALVHRRRAPLVDYVFGAPAPPEVDIDKPGWYRPLSNFMPYLAWLLLFAFVGLSAFGAFTNHQWSAPAFQFQPEIAAALLLSLLVLYVVLDIG